MAPAPKSSIEEGDVSAILHPLVVINISDHYSRSVAQLFHRMHSRANFDPDEVPPLTSADGDSIRVIGLLLGVQEGRTIEVCHSFELLARLDESRRVAVDETFMVTRMEQYKQIFAQYSVVGWYSTGTGVSEEDIRLHKGVFSDVNESPIYLMVDPEACTSSTYQRKTTNSLMKNGVAGASASSCAAGEPRAGAMDTGPIVLYETELKMINEQPKTQFTAIPYRLASADSERIALDHVSRHAVGEGLEAGSAVVNQHLGDLRRSVNMLCKRLTVLEKFLIATLEGKIEKNHALLRQVASLCAWLPTLQSSTFAEALDSERQDSTIVNYLAGATKSLCTLYDLVVKYQTTNNPLDGPGSVKRPSAGRGMWAL